MASMQTLTLPTRRDEAWRYSDHAALARVWPTLAAPERIVVAAGEQAVRIVDALPESGILQIEAELGEDARLALFGLVAGHDYGRLEVAVRLASGAHLELGAAILGGGAQTLEVVTRIDHAEPDATSNQVVRSVLGGRATGSFLGKVHVARDAQRTDAEQSVKAMLLDRGATANAVPQLEIYADDVKCAHGATRSRGVPADQARSMLVQAFLHEAFEGLADDVLREALTEAVDGWWVRHGTAS